MARRLILTCSSPNCRQNTSKSGGNILPGVPAATYGFGSGIYPPLPVTPCGKNIKQSWRFPQESRNSSHAVIRAYDERGNLIETHGTRAISTTRFLPWRFSPGDKIENCVAQFLAVCWIVHVEFKVHRLRHGFSVSNALLLGESLTALIGHNLDKIGDGTVL